MYNTRRIHVIKNTIIDNSQNYNNIPFANDRNSSPRKKSTIKYIMINLETFIQQMNHIFGIYYSKYDSFVV